jgi:ssDNA-binding Zn-finger/Zn-ribbon topoisomerase 1
MEGKAVAWVLRGKCPKCGKGLMGKPRGKDGSVRIRSPEYVCPACGYTVAKEEYEGTLTCNIQYTCPYCRKQGEAQVPYKRKTFEGVQAVVFECQHCHKKLGISKKMKAGKGAGEAEDDADEDV